MLPTAASSPPPFLLASRRIRRRIANALPVTLGGATVPVDLDPLGYTRGLWVRLTGSVTVATAPLVFNASGICAASSYDALSRFLLDTPGPASPYDASGDQTHLQGLLNRSHVIDRQMGRYDRTMALDANAYATANQEDSFPVAVGVNQVVQWHYIPFVRNARDTLRGLLGLGHAGTKTTLRIFPAPLADFVTVPANVTAQALVVDVWQDIFTAPPPGVETPSDRFVLSSRQQTDGLPLKLGDNPVDIDTTGLVLNVTHKLIANNAPDTADIATLRLETNFDRIKDDEALDVYLKELFEMRGAHLPLGVIAYDRDVFAADLPFVDQYGERPREAIFAGELNRFRSTITLKQTTALGAVSKIVTSVRRLELLPGGG